MCVMYQIDDLSWFDSLNAKFALTKNYALDAAKRAGETFFWRKTVIFIKNKKKWAKDNVVYWIFIYLYSV